MPTPTLLLLGQLLCEKEAKIPVMCWGTQMVCDGLERRVRKGQGGRAELGPQEVFVGSCNCLNSFQLLSLLLYSTK